MPGPSSQVIHNKYSILYLKNEKVVFLFMCCKSQLSMPSSPLVHGCRWVGRFWYVILSIPCDSPVIVRQKKNYNEIKKEMNLMNVAWFLGECDMLFYSHSDYWVIDSKAQHCSYMQWKANVVDQGWCTSKLKRRLTKECSFLI